MTKKNTLRMIKGLRKERDSSFFMSVLACGVGTAISSEEPPSVLAEAVFACLASRMSSSAVAASSNPRSHLKALAASSGRPRAASQTGDSGARHSRAQHVSGQAAHAPAVARHDRTAPSRCAIRIPTDTAKDTAASRTPL